MKFKTLVAVAGLLSGSYLLGKIVGAKSGASSVLEKYKDVIPENEMHIKLTKVAGCDMFVVVNKKGS